jgi:hypothetical protein
MLKKTLIACTLLAATALPAALAALPPAEAWEIGPWVRGRNYSVGVPTAPVPVRGGGVGFDFPQSGGEVDAMTTPVGPLGRAREITIRYRIDAARGTQFLPAERSEAPAAVSLYIQQRGDNWSGRGRYESFRWYVPGNAVIPLAPGVRTITVRLDDQWTNVNGRSNADDPRGFAAALADAERVGIAFGTTYARSHGVFATGPARFTLLAFDIR